MRFSFEVAGEKTKNLILNPILTILLLLNHGTAIRNFRMMNIFNKSTSFDLYCVTTYRENYIVSLEESVTVTTRN